MDRNEIYTGKARLVNRGNGIVLRCATKGELAALLSLLRALFPHDCPEVEKRAWQIFERRG